MRLWCRLDDDDDVPLPIYPPFDFKAFPDVKVTVNGLKKPIDYFSLYFDDEIVN